MFLLLDIGGTKTRIAISHNGDELDAIKIIPTAQNFNEAISNIDKYAKELSSNNKITAAAIGTPGPHNQQKTIIVNAPNLQKWHNQPLKKELERILNTTIYIENDADLAGLGEAVLGAGKDYKTIAYLTISTGIGGSRIVNQQIDQGVFSFEPGHQIITHKESNEQLTLENCISGASFKKRYGKPAKEIFDTNIWDETTKLLAIGLHNITVHWSPHCIVIGGSMTKNISFDKLRTDFHKISTILPELPTIKHADLGNKAGLYGALTYLNKHS